MFDLRSPCVSCPFRKGQGELFELHPERLEEIFEAPAFQCHKTVDYSGDEPDSGSRPQQCAGLMSVLHREDQPNQIMQVGYRLGALDLDKLDPRGEAYDTIDAVREAHARAR
jgi:hypothetical protein